MSNSDETRWKQRLENFENVLAQLVQACSRDRYSDLERVGLIKIFEFCFELSWSVLKDLLFHEGHDVRAPRAAFRKGFEAGFINQDDCDTLLEALDRRTTLSHAYRKNLALEAEALIKGHYQPVLSRLHGALRARAGQ